MGVSVERPSPEREGGRKRGGGIERGETEAEKSRKITDV